MTGSEQSLNESLSAAIDGEAEELELRRVLNATSGDPDLRAKWERLHLIRSVMRRETLPVVNSPLPEWPADDKPHRADRPTTDDLAVESRTTSAARKRWLAPVGSVALTAAAALAVVLYFGPGQTDHATGPVVAERTPQPAHGLANVPTELDLRRANAYIYQHARGTSINARPAAMPFVKELSTTHNDPERPDSDVAERAASLPGQ